MPHAAALTEAAEDRRAVEELVTRLYVLLDEQRYDELDTIYSNDAVLRLPAAEIKGLEEIRAVARRRGETYARMQHISTDVLVELDGDRASVRTNHLAFHLHEVDPESARYDAGVVHRFQAARTADGWRLTRTEGDVVWTQGAVRR